MRSVLGYTSTSRAAAKGPQAFESATKYVIANLLKSMHKRLEVECFYGQDSIGAIASVSGQDLVISDASWAPGIWAGSENMPIEIRSSGGVLRGSANVASVDLSGKSISLDAMPAGAQASDVLYFKGAYGKEFAGIKKITTNSSTLFGIDASQYSLWKGNTYPVGGLLSLEKIELAIAKAVEKGLDSDVVCFVNPSVFSLLVADEAALRKYDASYKPEMGENGFSKLKFHAINGAITIEPSIYVKQGDAFMFNPKELLRVGSSDVTLKRPGAPDQFMKELENSTGFELRAWCDLALFTAFPGHSVYLSGITLS